MKIIKDVNDEFQLQKSVVTIGTFDGLHIGHIKIIDSLKIKAKDLKTDNVVITFYPHPRIVLNKDFDIKLLTPLDEKIKIFEKLNVDYLYIIPFTDELAKTTYKEFVGKFIIKKTCAQALIVGYDHKFGNNREGDKNNLQEYLNELNIEMMVIGPEKIENEPVSSTKIRKAILSGDLETAYKMLGRYYFVEGLVVEGAKRGRTLGFPTANLKPVENEKLIPQNGVYFVRVAYDNQQYFGVANVGLRPTFNNVKMPITEVFIFDFDKEIYGEKIGIEFIKKLRDEQKFNSIKELETQIKSDVENAKNLINTFN